MDLLLELAGDGGVGEPGGCGGQRESVEAEAMATDQGSSLGRTARGVFLSMVIERASSVRSFVDDSRSLATDAASLPVSCWMLRMWALISKRSFWRCWTMEPSTVFARLAWWSATWRVFSRTP